MTDRPMKGGTVLTNFVLAYLGILVLLLFGLGVAFYPFDSAEKLFIFLALLVGINLLGAIVAGIIQVKLIGKDSMWLRPASERMGNVITNSVVAIWLCGVAFIAFVVLKTNASTTLLVGSIFLVLAGAALGRYVHKRSLSKSWLPYGIGFSVAVAVMLVVVATIRTLG